MFMSANFSSFFFLQAEDGIRDTSVTGVQTCALPISACVSKELAFAPPTVASMVAINPPYHARHRMAFVAPLVARAKPKRAVDLALFYWHVDAIQHRLQLSVDAPKRIDGRSLIGSTPSAHVITRCVHVSLFGAMSRLRSALLSALPNRRGRNRRFNGCRLRHDDLRVRIDASPGFAAVRRHEHDVALRIGGHVAADVFIVPARRRNALAADRQRAARTEACAADAELEAW